MVTKKVVVESIVLKYGGDLGYFFLGGKYFFL